MLRYTRCLICLIPLLSVILFHAVFSGSTLIHWSEIWFAVFDVKRVAKWVTKMGSNTFFHSMSIWHFYAWLFDTSKGTYLVHRHKPWQRHFCGDQVKWSQLWELWLLQQADLDWRNKFCLVKLDGGGFCQWDISKVESNLLSHLWQIDGRSELWKL